MQTRESRRQNGPEVSEPAGDRPNISRNRLRDSAQTRRAKNASAMQREPLAVRAEG